MLAMEKKTHQKTLANLLRIMLKNNPTQDNTKSNIKTGCSLCGFSLRSPREA